MRSPVNSGKTFELVPAGNHIARLVRLIHIGTIPGEYLGQQKETDTVRLTFEIPEELRVFKEGTEPQPMIISQEFTNSMGEKANLRKIVQGMLGTDFKLDDGADEFTLDQLVGKACMLNVIHKTSGKGNQYAVLASTAPLPKGLEAKPQANDSFIFDFEDNWSEEKFQGIPDYLKAKIQSSRQYKQKFGLEEPTAEGVVDAKDIPF